MKFFEQYWILFTALVLVAGNDFEEIENHFVQYFGNKENPIKWDVARHLYDFKRLVKICDQMKVLRGETAVITDLRVNADEDQNQETGDNPDQDTGKNTDQEAEKHADEKTTENPDVKMDENPDQEMDENPGEGTRKIVKQETVKKTKKPVVQNPNLGHKPGVLLFRNQNYKSREIDVLRCEIANTKHLATGRRYVYVSKGNTKVSYYLLVKAEMTANSYFLERLESPTLEPDRKINGPHLAATVWLADE